MSNLEEGTPPYMLYVNAPHRRTHLIAAESQQRFLAPRVLGIQSSFKCLCGQELCSGSLSLCLQPGAGFALGYAVLRINSAAVLKRTRRSEVQKPC